MRTINRALATSALVLPLSLGAAGIAAADSHQQPRPGAPAGVAEQVTDTVEHVIGKHGNGSVIDHPNAPGHNDGTGNAAGKFVPF